MMRFKCIYCGQRIVSRDDGAGRKGKCPKCLHLLLVPRTTKGRPAISIEKTEPMQHPKDAAAGRDSGFTKPHDLPEEQKYESAELFEEKAGWFIPIYDELSLFLMAVTLILLCAVNAPMREWVHKMMTEFHDYRVCILALIFLGGLGLSLYHVFTTREKTLAEKYLMLFFAVLTNAGSGIIAGVYVIKNSDVRNWLIVFPIWNIVNGILLLLMLRLRIIDEDCISDRDATFFEVVLSLTAVVVILILCDYVFKLYWAVTFSICIVYTTSFDKALQSVLPGLTESRPPPQ